MIHKTGKTVVGKPYLLQIQRRGAEFDTYAAIIPTEIPAGAGYDGGSTGFQPHTVPPGSPPNGTSHLPL